MKYSAELMKHIDVSLHLVEKGFARFYEYCEKREDLQKAKPAAKKRNSGLGALRILWRLELGE